MALVVLFSFIFVLSMPGQFMTLSGRLPYVVLHAVSGANVC